MRVAVLGAGGTIAPAIVRDLAESDEVQALRLLDLDLRRAEEVALDHGLGKAAAYEADATSNLTERLAGIDVLVNSAAYRINLAAMSSCLEAGCHYMDLGGLYHITREQFALSARFEAQGLLALLGVGSAPGKTNLLAARAVAQLPGEPVSISVAAAGRDLTPTSGLSFPYAVRTLIDELTMPPMAVINGKPEEHLNELVGASEERIADAARSASPPSDSTVAVHVVEAAGAATTIRARSVTEPIERWGIGGGVVSTATPAAAAVRLLARGRITAIGAMPPERCIDPDEMFAELERRAVRFEVSSLPRAEARPLFARMAR